MILWRAGWRHLVRHPWQNLLALVGIALGVGVVTAVDLANETATRSFRFAATALAGKATHTVTGATVDLDEKIYRLMRAELGVRPSAPVVEGHVALAKAGATLRLIGVDPFAESSLRTFSSRFTEKGILKKLLIVPGTVLLLPETARRLGVAKGESFVVETGGIRHSLQLAGYLEPDSDLTRAGLESVVVSDVSTAQEILRQEGKLSRIDLILPEGKEGDAVLTLLREKLPAGIDIVPAGARAGALDRMTKAFRLNLTALSLLALVVGMFLIYNTITFSVIRRRRFIGLLRAIGVTRREIFLLMFSEVALLALLGTAIGLLFGIMLGENLTRLVTRTINDLYFVMEVRNVQILPGSLLKGALLGIGATLLAALPPLREATAAPPRAVLSRSIIEVGHRRTAPRTAVAGLFLLCGAVAILAVPEWGLGGGFTGLFLLIIGYAFLIPLAVLILAPLLRPLLGILPGPLGRMAARGVVVSLSRTGIATAALVVAVSAGIGVGIMVGSFRLTVESWLESWLRADVYVTTVGTGSGRGKPPLDADLVQRLRGVPGAFFTSLTRRISVETPQGPVDLLAMELPRETFMNYRFREGSGKEAWAGFSAGTAVIVSEPYAYRHNVHVGDRVTLPAPGGMVTLPVAGVYYDYGSDSGVIAMSRSAFTRFWRDHTVDGMGLYAADGITDSGLADAIRARAGSSRIEVIPNRELKRTSLAIFDRTFAITNVLRLVTVVVAFVGILSALMAIQVERARELAVARALGLTPAQVWGVVCGETLLIGIIAGLLSLPLGILQALVLIRVINLRSFGWTMEFTLDPALMLQAMLLSLTAALLAGIYPSFVMSRTSPALALKEEE